MKSYDLSLLNAMVVDDNRYMRFLIKTILHGFGIKSIAEAEDGSDALKILRTTSPDILITDWRMEPLDGIDLVRMIRQDSEFPNPFLPVIMLSGYTEMGKVSQARDAGINEFLAKPVSATALYSRLIRIIEKPRPFVKTKSYIGPDRRRKQNDSVATLRRASDGASVQPRIMRGLVSQKAEGQLLETVY